MPVYTADEHGAASLASAASSGTRSPDGCRAARFEVVPEENGGGVDRLPKSNPLSVIEYLGEEVPWELERLESLDQLVTSWRDWASASSDPRLPTYSSWLQETYRMFQRSPGLDGVG